MGGAPGVASAKVVVLGVEVEETNAVNTGGGLEAQILISDWNLDRLLYLDEIMEALARLGIRMTSMK